MEILQAKLRQLERKYELQAIKHDELTLEMTELRQEAEKAKQRPAMNTIEIQTEMGRLIDKMDNRLSQPPPELPLQVPTLSLTPAGKVLPDKPDSSSSNKGESKWTFFVKLSWCGRLGTLFQNPLVFGRQVLC